MTELGDLEAVNFRPNSDIDENNTEFWIQCVFISLSRICVMILSIWTILKNIFFSTLQDTHIVFQCIWIILFDFNHRFNYSRNLVRFWWWQHWNRIFQYLLRECNELFTFSFLNTNCMIISTLSIHLLVKYGVASEECQICTLYLMLYTVQYL